MKDGDVLAQIETDKVTVDIRYTEAQPGVVSKVLVGVEDQVEVGQQIFVCDVGATGGKEAAAPKEEAAPQEEAAPPAPKEEKKAESQPKEAAKPPPAPEKPKPPPAPAPPKGEVGTLSD